MPDTLTYTAPAKINLYLHVTGKRPDGYHILESIVVFAADINDIISITPAPTLSLEITGSFADRLEESDDNLILQAARLLAKETGYTSGAHITLDKSIPVAAGIGGGSSDAAATLQLLNTLWNTKLPQKELMQLGLTLGADVPVCLMGKAAFMSGIGDIVTPMDALPPLYALLVNSYTGLPTREVFSALKGDEYAPIGGIPIKPSIPWLMQQHNNLERPAVILLPSIDEMLYNLRDLQGCMFSRMSGSGSTCFGLFPSIEEAEAAQTTIAAQHPDWWARTTQLV